MKTRRNSIKRGGGKGNKKKTGKAGKKNYKHKTPLNRRPLEKIGFKAKNIPPELKEVLEKSRLPPQNIETATTSEKIRYLENFQEFLDYITDIFDESEDETIRDKVFELATFLEGRLRPLAREENTDVENIVAQFGRLAIRRENRGPIDYLDALDTFLTNFIKKVKNAEKRLRRGEGTMENLSGSNQILLDSIHIAILAAVDDFKGFLREERAANVNVEMAGAPAGGAGRVAPAAAADEDDDLVKMMGRLGL